MSKKWVIFIFLFFFIASIQSDDISIVSNLQWKDLTKGQLKQIIKGDREEWPDGTKVIILLNNDDKIMEDFCRQYLGMSYYALQEFYVTQNIRTGKPYPRKVSTDVILTLVNKSKAFIGIVPTSEVTNEVNSYN